MRRLESNAIVRADRSLRRVAGLRSRAWLSVAALLLQLALPFVHSLEIRLAFAQASASSLRGDAHTSPRELDSATDTRTFSPAPVAAHDEQSCPICAAFSHAHAATADAARVGAPFKSVPLVVPAESRTPPSLDVASPDARAPPSASRIAIS